MGDHEAPEIQEGVIYSAGGYCRPSEVHEEIMASEAMLAEDTVQRVTVRAGDLQTAVAVLEALNPFESRAHERWLDRLKDALP